MAIDLSSYSGKQSPAVLNAVRAIFEAKPDQEQVLVNEYGGDLDRWLEGFKGWWDANGRSAEGQLDKFGPEMGLLDALGFAPPSSSTVSLERGGLQTALPAIANELGSYNNRSGIAQGLANQAITATGATANQLQRLQPGGFDSSDYLARNAQVQGLFNSLNDGATPGTKSVPVQGGPPQDMTAQQFAEWHFKNVGQREGLTGKYIPSQQLTQDLSNVDGTTAANIAAAGDAFKTSLAGLTEATGTLSANLTGNLGARAQALEGLIGTLTQNLDTYDGAQKTNLANQIVGLQKNLDESIGAQRSALQDQLASLGGVATTEAAARRQALQTEIAALTAAQAPLADARMKAAELQATAVNVGLQRTQDQLAADQAKAGYVGGSTVSDANLARATIDARQRAAQAVGGARVANASDTRDIGVHGASGERSIADALAGANRDIGILGAGGTRDLANSLATGRQKIGDFGTNTTAGINNTTAAGRLGIGNTAATTTFNDRTFGANEQRTIDDALAKGKAGLVTGLAGSTFDLTKAGNAAKQGFNDNEFARSLAGSLSLQQLPGTLSKTLTGIDDYATSGIFRGANLMNLWANPATTAPTPGATAVQPGTTGNGISTIGTGLINLGANVGQANNWWVTPKPKTTGPTGTDGDGFTNP